jgi:hypothetical protein
MPHAETHPTPQELAAFGLGKPTQRAAVAAVAAHLESCPACREATATFPSGGRQGHFPETDMQSGQCRTTRSASASPALRLGRRSTEVTDYLGTPEGAGTEECERLTPPTLFWLLLQPV